MAHNLSDTFLFKWRPRSISRKCELVLKRVNILRKFVFLIFCKYGSHLKSCLNNLYNLRPGLLFNLTCQSVTNCSLIVDLTYFLVSQLNGRSSMFNPYWSAKEFTCVHQLLFTDILSCIRTSRNTDLRTEPCGKLF